MAGSYSFGASTDRIVFSDVTALDALNLADYLIHAWIRPTGAGSNNGRITSRDDGSAGATGHMQLMVGNGANGTRNGEFTARQRYTTGAELAVSPSGLIANNAWVCLAAHFKDARGGNARYRLFVDATEQSPATTQEGSVAQDFQVDSAFCIGNGVNADRNYAGLMAYLALYDTVDLSDFELETLVGDLYGGGSGEIVVPAQEILVDFILMDEEGATDGELGIFTDAFISGATFTATNPPPVTYTLGLLPQKLRPDGDLATTGWSTAPLHSKIEEEIADGTVITGVAS